MTVKCIEVKKELSAYLSGELTPRRAAAMEEHLAVCGACAREMVQLQQLERRLRAGLRRWAETGEETDPSFWPELRQKAAALSPAEINRRRNFTLAAAADCAGQAPDRAETEKGKPKRLSRLYRACGIAAVLAVFVLLVAFWPQAVKAATRLPLVGPLVQELVLRDAGLSWAYENGYIEDRQLSAGQEEITLTILGTVADPVQTTVIYLLEGWPEPGNQTESDDHGRDSRDGVEKTASLIPPLSIRAVDGAGAASWQQPGMKTPLGLLGYVQTRPLPEGEHVLTVSLGEAAGLNENLEIELTVSRDEVSRLSESFALDYTRTVEGVTLQAEQVVYTPTQIMVEFSVAGGGCLEGAGRPEYNFYLLTAQGDKLENSSGTGYQAEDGSWKLQRIFERPADIGELQMVVPALGRFEAIEASFTPQDLERLTDYHGHKIELREWRQRREQLLLTLGWPAGGPTQTLANWTISLAQGAEIEAPVWQQEWHLDENSDQYVVVYHLEHDPGMTPVAAVAGKVQRIVEGNWTIALPVP